LSIEWRSLEKKWQSEWEKNKVYESDPDDNKPKFFITVAYPYPNSPQHIGHGRTYTLTDVYARFKRMEGFNVLFPMAFHYTGTPVLAMSKRVAEGERELINDFINIYKVPKEVVETFVEPIKIANYFRNEIKQGMKEIGYSIDWRREFTTIDSQYHRFIEWQIKCLRSKGLITKGSHPVGWCPSCGSPMGQHDTKGDIDPEIGELILIKFQMGDVYLPTGTLRPETVFGVTNIWLRPDLEYVQAKVGEEDWIISKECADKLRYLNQKVKIKGTIEGRKVIGKKVINPMTEDRISVLPASFVDPNNATGIVMSVPAHAPVDYVALMDVKKNTELLKAFNIEAKDLEKLEPVSIIKLDGYSNTPASDALKRFEVKDQSDPKLEDATKEVYNQEFHRGMMKKNTGIYKGMTVPESREKVKADMIHNGKAEIMYDLLNRPIYCRCGTECIVKIFENQWFINYGNQQWKRLAHECLNNMRIVREELRREFENVIDWLRERACARKQGLGTKLPWDPDWIIESLSDSVIYMAYYILSKYINKHQISPEQLNYNFFNYVLLGEGNQETVAENTGLKIGLLKEIRKEFLYYYPLDSRNSGRDLISNHLTFFIFNHAAIFSREHWPRQIVVNGSVLMEGKKMSKSFGNIIPLREAINLYGADPLRMTLLSTAQSLQDADFSRSLASSLRDRLNQFYTSALKIIEMESFKEKKLIDIDKWMISRLHQHVKSVTKAMEDLRIRTAVHNALYTLDQEIQWYTRRTSSANINSLRRSTMAWIFKEILKKRVLLLAPIIPHLCEEIWKKMGNNNFITLASWPEYDESQIDLKVIEQEKIIQSLYNDTLEVIRVTGIKPKKIHYYTTSPWKWQIYIKALKTSEKAKMMIGDFIRVVMTDLDMRERGNEATRFSRKVFETANKMSQEMLNVRLIIGEIDELTIILNAHDFFVKELGAEVKVYRDDDPNIYDPEKKANRAEPFRPSIFIE
jgi:leucyl-tRNA synthetase